jgi:protease IV
MADVTSWFGRLTKVLGLLAMIFFFFMMASVFQFFRVAMTGGIDAEDKSAPHLTELRIEGPIFSAEAWLESIGRISKDKACKGVLVRIESPGGAVGASQEVFQALNGLREKGLPVIVSQANVAASGGYYISLAGDRIFTNPGTLTGSIGVIFQFPEAEKLMDKVGVDLRTVKSGALKDVGNFSRSATPAELSYLQGVIDDVHAQFIADILGRRSISRDSLLQVADGRVITGSQAVAWGLADTLGGYESARRYLAQKTGVDADTPLHQEPPKREWYDELLEPQAKAGMNPSDLAALANRLSDWAGAVLPSAKPGLFFLMPRL